MCTSPCSECVTDTVTCTACVNDFYLEIGTNNPNNCETCIPNCKTCSPYSVGECTVCKTNYEVDTAHLNVCWCAPGYYMYLGTCDQTCPFQFFDNPTTRTCDACPTLCSSCESLTSCTGCIGGYILNG